MKIKLWLRRAAAGALCLFLCIVSLTGPAHAAIQPIDDLDVKCSLTVMYKHADTTVKLYRVAGVDKNVKFVPEGQFKEILEGLGDETLRDLNALNGKWRRLADSLDLEIVKRGDIEPAGEVKTVQEDGGAAARFEELTPGLYLVVNEPYSITQENGDGGKETVRYAASPYLVCLPNWSEKDGSWQKDVTMDISGKMDSSVGDTVSLRVLKVWAGSGSSNHPESVTINLLRDGKVYDTVELNENGWSAFWTNLDNSYRWDIEEVRIPGWSVSVDSDNGRDFVVTNTKNRTPPGGDPSGGNPPGGNPPGGEPTDEVTIDDPDVPLSVPPIEDEPQEPEEIEIDDPDVPLSELPQTGQLWWPVPMLAVGGMFLLVLGWGRNRRGRCDEE